MKKRPGISSLQREKISPPVQFDEDDLLSQLEAKAGSTLWLGNFTAEQIAATLEKSGIFAALRQKGLVDFAVYIEPLDDFSQALKVFAGAGGRRALLAEARFREAHFDADEARPGTFGQERPLVLAIDWLLMQNPFAAFVPAKPKLPGQQHPGLGLARRVLQLIVRFAKHRTYAAVLNFPEYYHNAYLYRSHFSFYNPEREAHVSLLHRDLHHLSLSQLSWAIEWGCVREIATPEPRYKWRAGIQILPLADAFQDYFFSAWYLSEVEKHEKAVVFQLETEKFNKHWRREFGPA